MTISFPSRSGLELESLDTGVIIKEDSYPDEVQEVFIPTERMQSVIDFLCDALRQLEAE